MHQHRIEKQRQHENGQSPPEEAARWILMHVENIGDEHDRAAIEQTAEEKREFGERLCFPDIPHVEAEGVNTDDGGEEHKYLDRIVQQVPAQADDEQGREPDKKGRDANENVDGDGLTPSSALRRRFVEIEN